MSDVINPYLISRACSPQRHQIRTAVKKAKCGDGNIIKLLAILDARCASLDASDMHGSDKGIVRKRRLSVRQFQQYLFLVDIQLKCFIIGHVVIAYICSNPIQERVGICCGAAAYQDNQNITISQENFQREHSFIGESPVLRPASGPKDFFANLGLSAKYRSRIRVCRHIYLILARDFLQPDVSRE